MNAKNDRSTTARRQLGEGRWALGLALALAGVACSSKGSPRLVTLSVTPGSAYVATGESQQLAASGTYSDGSTRTLSGLAWSSSNAAVATVDAGGVVTSVAAGTATITAAAAGGIAGTAEVTARNVTALAAGTAVLPHAGRVDTTQVLHRVSGLAAGTFYELGLGALQDDVDLAVYADLSLSEEALLCVSQRVGAEEEGCEAPAGAGELYVLVDGSWSEEGSEYLLEVRPSSPVPIAATLAFPADLPVSGTVGTEYHFYWVTGLTPGASYSFRISGLTDDVDLEVYGDRFEFGQLCASTASGTEDDACVAAANAGGAVLVEVDGENTASGSAFTLSVAAAP